MVKVLASTLHAQKPAAQRRARLLRKRRPKSDSSSARGSTKGAAKSMTVTVKDRALVARNKNAWLSGNLRGYPTKGCGCIRNHQPGQASSIRERFAMQE